MNWDKGFADGKEAGIESELHKQKTGKSFSQNNRLTGDRSNQWERGFREGFLTGSNEVYYANKDSTGKHKK